MARKSNAKQFISRLSKAVDEVEIIDVDDYEMMVMLKPLLPEDVKDRTVEDLKTLISNQSGEILSEDVWGKKHLAYKIDGNDEGYYIVYSLRLRRSTITQIERGLKLMPNVLRSMIVKQSEL